MLAALAREFEMQFSNVECSGCSEAHNTATSSFSPVSEVAVGVLETILICCNKPYWLTSS